MDETGRTLYFRKNSIDSWEYFGTFNEPTKVYIVNGDYEWHRSDGSIYIFQGWDGGLTDPSGELIAIVDSQGNRQSLTYDAEERLETVTDEATGRFITFHYNTNGLLDHISGPVTASVPDGIWVSYGYDALGNLTTVSYADGSGRIYEYDDPNDPHNLTAEKDQNGNVIFTWAYDSQDRGISNTTNDDRSVTIDYINDTTIDVTNGYGVTHTSSFDKIAGKNRMTAINGPEDCLNCGEETVRYAYNDKGRVEEVEYVNGRIDRYEDYDSRGNSQTEIRDYGGPNQTTIQTVYHPRINEPLTRTQASALGTGDKETIWDYDDDGNEVPNEDPTAYVHRLIERGFTMDEQGGAAAYEYVTRLEYNDKGQVTAIDGPRPGAGDTITYSYDSATANLLSMTLPLVGTTYYDQYDDAGNPTLITDPNGIQTSLTYDGRNRVLTMTRNGHTASTVYTLAGKPDLVTDAAGRTLDFQYDPKNYLQRITDPAGNYQSFGYTTLGNIENESIYTSNDVLSRTIRYDYGDPLGNPNLEAGKPWKAIRRNHDDSADLETLFAYDVMGNLSGVTDAENHTTTYLYDNLNRLECMEQPGQAVTYYGYDAHGNLTGITDPEGLLTQYLYDDLGRLVKTDSPDTGTVFYQYDEAGNLVRKDANGQVTTYAYDENNRRTDITYADGTPGVAYVYDSGSGQHLKGRLASVLDGSGERHFSYDANGFLDSEQRIIQAVAYLTDYEFDPAGNLRSITYPTGQTVAYQPDATDVGQISAVRLDPTGADLALAAAIAYKPFGPISGLTLGNGLQTSQSYDLNYQIASINSGSALSRTYTPDGNGNIIAIADNLDNTRSQSFTYDSLQRLTHASGIYGTIDFTYDKNGNRQTRTAAGVTDTYTYLAGTNRIDTITGSASINFDHDANGNLIGRTFLTAPAPAPAPAQDYTYTHDGQRLAKTIDTQATVFHYDIAGQLIAETDAASNMIKAYVWLHGQPLAQIAADGSIYYYHNDHLGTPQRMTDSSAALVWSADYLPFGKADVTLEAVENNLRFAGQYYDSETGLHYNYWRFYDPSLGRYLRADPIGLAGGINPYAYVQNNPVNAIDPYGLINLLFGGGGSAVAVAGVEGSAGVVLNPGLGGSKADAGVFGSVGGGLGINVSADAFVGFFSGDISNVSGTSINGNFTIGPISIVGLVDINTGEFLGGTIGLGPSATPIGGSITGSFTETYTIRDFINDIGKLFNMSGDPCK